MIKRTLVVFKPDAIKRGIVGELLTRFERAGLKIIAMKMVKPDEEHFHKHYEEISQLVTRWGEDIYNVTLAQMTESPVIAVVLEGVDAIEYVRKMVGTTDPKESPPGTIRGDYTHLAKLYTNERGGTLPNLIHASGNEEEAQKELDLWFDESELYDYTVAHEDVIRGFVPDIKKNPRAS